MISIDLPDAAARQLEAIAELDGVRVDDIVEDALERLIADRRTAIERAYRALNGHTPPPTPADDNVLDDICDECDQRHGPGDPECAAQDPEESPPVEPLGLDQLDPSDPVEKPEVAPEPPRAGAGSGRDVWAAYAREELGLTSAPNERRSEIIRAVDVHRGRIDPDAAPTVREVFPSADDGHDGHEDAPSARGSCQAARCGEDALPGGAKFCQHHTSQVPRLAEKLRRSHNPPANASAEAVRRLIEGVR